MKELEEVIRELEDGEGARIGVAAAVGHELAYDVVKWYQFMADCPGDPGGQAFFLIAYDKWQQAVSAEQEDDDVGHV